MHVGKPRVSPLFTAFKKSLSPTLSQRARGLYSREVVLEDTVYIVSSILLKLTSFPAEH